VLLPRRGFTSAWQRILHDRTADKIATVVSQVPHVAATIVPFNLTSKLARRGRHYREVVNEAMQQESGDRTDTDPGADPTPPRQRARPHAPPERTRPA